MLEAGVQLVYGTARNIKDVMYFYLLCALEKTCMAPKGATTACNLAPDRYNVYSKCHRFDQSVFNILLYWAVEFDVNRLFNREFFERLISIKRTSFYG